MPAGTDWIAEAVAAARDEKRVSTAVAEEIEQRLRGAMSERDLRTLEFIEFAKHLIALERKRPALEDDGAA